MKFSSGFYKKYIYNNIYNKIITAQMSGPTVTKDNYFDVAQGLYWFASNWHGGQSSQLYSLLSTLGYKPSHSENGPEEGDAKDIYDYLENLAQTNPNSAEDAAVKLGDEVKRVYDETRTASKKVNAVFKVSTPSLDYVEFETADEAIAAVEKDGKGEVIGFTKYPNRPGLKPDFEYASYGLWYYQDGKWEQYSIHGGTSQKISEEKPH